MILLRWSWLAEASRRESTTNSVGCWLQHLVLLVLLWEYHQGRCVGEFQCVILVQWSQLAEVIERVERGDSHRKSICGDSEPFFLRDGQLGRPAADFWLSDFGSLLLVRQT